MKTLWDIQIAARRDPITSHIAAREVTISGRRADQMMQVVHALHCRPGRSSRELADESGLDRYVVARRLPDAERCGLVRRGGMRSCRLSARPAVVWFACDTGGKSDEETDC